MNKEQILSLIRHLLTTVGVFLVLKGDIDEGLITEAIGSIITSISIIWGVFDKTPKQIEKKYNEIIRKKLD
jgi:hypothetical protein